MSRLTNWEHISQMASRIFGAVQISLAAAREVQPDLSARRRGVLPGAHADFVNSAHLQRTILKDFESPRVKPIRKQ